MHRRVIIPMLLSMLAFTLMLSAQSPSPITAPLVVVSPNGGESWLVGSTQLITWKYDGKEPRSFQILLSTDGGKTYPNVIAKDVPGSAREFKWLVKAAATKMAIVKIMAPANPTEPRAIEDTSDGMFMIMPSAAIQPGG